MSADILNGSRFGAQNNGCKKINFKKKSYLIFQHKFSSLWNLEGMKITMQS